MINRFVNVCVAQFLIISATALNAADQNDWEEVRNIDDIRIFTRDIPDSPLIAVRGTSPLDADIFKTGHIIRDVSRYPEWVPQLKIGRIIEHRQVAEWLAYLLIELPWPVSDRDVLMHIRADINENADRITFNVHSVALESVPELPGVVRAEIPLASILLTANGQGQTQTCLDAHMQLDLKGLIPGFVNYFITRKLPVKLITRLRKQTGKEDIVVDTRFWNDLNDRSAQMH